MTEIEKGMAKGLVEEVTQGGGRGGVEVMVMEIEKGVVGEVVKKGLEEVTQRGGWGGDTRRWLRR